MSWPSSQIVLILALAVWVYSIAMFCGMTFQSGWANGWPMGISKQAAYSFVVTAIAAVNGISLAVAILIVLRFLAESMFKKPYMGWSSSFVLLAGAVVVVLAACLSVFESIYSRAVQEWP